MGGKRGDHNTRQDQIFPEYDTLMLETVNHSRSDRHPDFEIQTNMDSFLKGTEYDIFGQVDR